MSDCILFLDIDGVLNGHRFVGEALSCNIVKPCVQELNRIIRVTECKVVLSSAWRYMVTGGAMTVGGFAYMLRTHGAIGAWNWLIDTTAPDEHCPECGYRHRKRKRGGGFECKYTPDGYYECIKCHSPSHRAAQVKSWLRRNPAWSGPHVVVDDDDYEFTASKIPFVQTDGAVGLTRTDADRVIELLRREGA